MNNMLNKTWHVKHFSRFSGLLGQGKQTWIKNKLSTWNETGALRWHWLALTTVSSPWRCTCSILKTSSMIVVQWSASASLFGIFQQGYRLLHIHYIYGDLLCSPILIFPLSNLLIFRNMSKLWREGGVRGYNIQYWPLPYGFWVLS